MKRVYIDIDGCIADWQGHYDLIKSINPESKYPQTGDFFFQNLEPIWDGVDFVEKMMHDDGYDTWLLTAPYVWGERSYTGKRIWVENYLGLDACFKLIMCPDKSLMKGDFLIDDHYDSHGQKDFEGELILYGSDMYPDWHTVSKKFFG